MSFVISPTRNEYVSPEIVTVNLVFEYRWNFIFFANVRDHRHRTAGATDAGEERAAASGVKAGRCSVDRIVGHLSSAEKSIRKLLVTLRTCSRGAENARLLPSFIESQKVADSVLKEITQIRSDFGIMPKSD